MKDILECYKTLGIEPGAAPERIRIAYLQLSRFYDPARDAGVDPEVLAKSAQKRHEIEEAYQGICHFLPALKRDHEPSEIGVQNRDFQEMVQEGPVEVSRFLVAIILGMVIALVVGWGYYIYRKTCILTSAAAVNPNQEASMVPSSEAVLSTAPALAVDVE